MLDTGEQPTSVIEITSRDGRRVVIDKILTSNDIRIPFGEEVYVGVLWAANDSFNADQRNEVVISLMESGCRYLVFGGMDCELWHDDADLAWVKRDLESDPSVETPFVMTTGHAEQSDEDVIFFAFNCTNFDEHDFSRFLVLVIGNDPEKRSRIERLIEAALTAPMSGT